MLVQVLFICLLAKVSLIESADYVIADIVLPKTNSLDAYIEQIRNFWTHERMQAAKPLDITLFSLASEIILGNSNVSTGPASSVPGAIPSYNGARSRAISAQGHQVYTTGRVFWHVGTSYYSCSASVVVSNSKDLVSTAGHCVFDTDTKSWFNNNNWVFVPAYSNNYAPYGVWPARRFIASNSWLTSTNFNYDAAFVALNKLNGRDIQSILGAQGIAFNQPRLAHIYSFGYPVNLDSGLYLKSCSAYAQKSKYTQNSYVGQGLPCNMGHGCSGGPWLQNVVDSTGLGYITSVNSFMITNVPDVMNGPYFDSNTKALYDQATGM